MLHLQRARCVHAWEWPCLGVFMHAATLVLPSNPLTTYVNQTTTGTVLANALSPNGTTLSVTSFSVQGANGTQAAGGGPVQLLQPNTSRAAGTLELFSNGTYTFVAAPGFVGAVPAVTLTVNCSDGQSVCFSLTFDVLAGERDGGLARTLHLGLGARGVVVVVTGQSLQA